MEDLLAQFGEYRAPFWNVGSLKIHVRQKQERTDSPCVLDLFTDQPLGRGRWLRLTRRGSQNIVALYGIELERPPLTQVVNIRSMEAALACFRLADRPLSEHQLAEIRTHYDAELGELHDTESRILNASRQIHQLSKQIQLDKQRLQTKTLSEPDLSLTAVTGEELRAWMSSGNIDRWLTAEDLGDDAEEEDEEEDEEEVEDHEIHADMAALELMSFQPTPAEVAFWDKYVAGKNTGKFPICNLLKKGLDIDRLIDWAPDLGYEAVEWDEHNVDCDESQEPAVYLVFLKMKK